MPLSPTAEKLAALGLEANGDRLSLTVVDLAGNVLGSAIRTLDVLNLGPVPALQRLEAEALALCETLRPSVKLVGAFLAIPGLVDRSGEVVLRAPNLHWDGTAPAAHLEQLVARYPMPLRIGNDIDASARTVIHDLRAAGEDASSFVYVTGEVGIGAAITLNDQLMSGRHGWASELGHVCVDPQGEPCGCGARGCLESVAGVGAMCRATGCESVTEIVARLRDSDPHVTKAIANVGRALGIALSSALNVLDISAVVLGGSLAVCAEWLMAALSAELEERVLWSPYSGIEIMTVDAAPQRAARGAAMTAMSWLTTDPAAWLDAQ